MDISRRSLVVSGVVLLVVVAGWFLLLRDRSDLCADVNEVYAHAASGFAELREAMLEDGSGDWSTSAHISDADDCAITVDAERASFLCEWEHVPSEVDANARYLDLVAEVRSCRGDIVAEREDANVNHPDFFASTYFTTDGATVSVSLKNKNALGRVFTSVGVDATADAG